MFNLDGMIDPLIQRFTPHFETAGKRLSTFESRLLARLDLIIMKLDDEDFELADPRMRINIAITNGTVELANVPANEEWLLETVSYSSDIVSFLKINSGDRLVWAAPVIDTQNSFSGQGLIVPGGSLLTVVAQSSGQAYFQFRRRMPSERIKNAGGGWPEVMEPGGMPRRDLNQDAQHTGYQQHHTLSKLG